MYYMFEVDYVDWCRKVGLEVLEILFDNRYFDSEVFDTQQVRRYIEDQRNGFLGFRLRKESIWSKKLIKCFIS